MLHSKNLEVRKVTMVDLDGQNEVKLKELVQFEPHEFLVLKPKKGPARPGNYTIVIGEVIVRSDVDSLRDHIVCFHSISWIRV